MLYERAKTFRQSPSETLGLTNSWVAWQFDKAIWLEGRYIDGKLSETIGTWPNKKPRWTLQQVLNGQTERNYHGISNMLFLSDQSAVKM